VGWARARIGTLLRIKPFVEIKEGQVLNMGQTRTRKKGIAHLKNLLQQQGQLERLAILHTNAESDALAFLDDLGLAIPPNPLVVNVTTVIGTHAGPNALGFAAVLK
jgi:fatty acid-binding protein DegV